MENHNIEKSNLILNEDEGQYEVQEVIPSIREEDNKIFIDSSSSETKVEFFKVMDKYIIYIDVDEYQDKFGHNGLAHFNAVIYKTDKGKMIENPSIYVNKDAFLSNGEDYSDLIPIVVRHEVSEMWTYVKTGYSFSPAPPSIGEERRVAFAHGLALRKEYEYAFEIAKADRYLEFIKRHVGSNQNVVRENEEAYRLAKRRYEERSQKA